MDLVAGNPRLLPSSNPAIAVDYLGALVADDPDILAWRAMLCSMVRTMPGLAERAHPGGHLTASTVVVDPQHERALAIFHPKFERWLQVGGHCDGDTNLCGVALREAVEETGLDDLRIDPVPIRVSMHTGEPTGGAHMHLDTSFLACTTPGRSEQPVVSPEGHELRWFAAHEFGELVGEMVQLFTLGLTRARLRT
jgi:8-oxo-dGTP pyrophosphatase MutT (NUDIX family)